MIAVYGLLLQLVGASVFVWVTLRARTWMRTYGSTRPLPVWHAAWGLFAIVAFAVGVVLLAIAAVMRS